MEGEREDLKDTVKEEGERERERERGREREREGGGRESE